ncbi:hypothetical protein P8S54_04085 [Thiomicrospira sp. R3]|uniref:hypothetical protein n=1 Tax=Thiomicrospira sp. R3 TaxID=3035472 RepID=UPI00259B41A3|nr:hypothetical protein [Thiomicrospira sp. R3]WFE69486.1 hypothetical protein P8S54_04085 [Thiomicrospira sp. R3]
MSENLIERSNLITEKFILEQSKDFKAVVFQILGLPIYEINPNILRVHFYDDALRFEPTVQFGSITGYELLASLDNCLKSTLSLRDAV